MLKRLRIRMRKILWLQQNRLVPLWLRLFILRQAGIKIGNDSYVHWEVDITSSKLVMGDNTGISFGCLIDCGTAGIVLEDWVRLSCHVKILAVGHPIASSVLRRSVDAYISKPVVIKKGCWLQAGCTITPGVTVAEGCVIAVGAVVNKSTEPNGYYEGNPAVRVKTLKTEVFNHSESEPIAVAFRPRQGACA